MVRKYIQGGLAGIILASAAVLAGESIQQQQIERNDVPSAPTSEQTEQVEPRAPQTQAPRPMEHSLAYIGGSNDDGSRWYVSTGTENYLHYKTQNHRSSKYENYVTPDDHTIQRVAFRITEMSNSPEEKAQAILDYVRENVYYNNTIEETRDYVRFPLETLIERNGDCEDSSILAASLMKSVGIDAALILFEGHMAVGVDGNFEGRYWTSTSSGNKYYYAEAASSDFPTRDNKWKIGQLPEKHDRKAHLLEL